MAKLLDLYSDLNENHQKQRALRDLAVTEARNLNATETQYLNTLVAEDSKIQAAIFKAKGNHLQAADLMPGGKYAFAGAEGARTVGEPSAVGPVAPITRTGQFMMGEDYNNAFMAFLRSNGKNAPSALHAGFDPLFGGFALPALPGMSAAMYEGAGGSSGAAGGFAVSIPTDPSIVPLATPDLGVRSIASVMGTSTDIKIPIQSALATAAIKAESGATQNAFTASSPTLQQATLSAFMLGLSETASWELLQDVQVFQQFLVNDGIRATRILEDSLFVGGNGTTQPQGLLGNVGTGTGAAYAVTGTAATDAATLFNSTFDVLGTLKAQYFQNAGWLLNRATSVAIRKAQQQANLFAPVWTRENGRDMLHGFPVTYSSSMPGIPTATTTGVSPILFGSFADGYVIGDRGGSGVFVKILDQVQAVNGQLVILFYERTDGRVRRSEAIQQISFSHS